MRGLVKKSVVKTMSQLICCVGIFNISPANAGPADYVYMPTVTQGEREIDFKYGTAKEQDGTRVNVTSLGFGYGATDYWFTEVYLKREREGSDHLTIAEWENKFQLTETGKYFADVGLITEIEAPLSNVDAPWEFKIGPMFQTEFGKLQINANVLFERTFGGEDVDHITEMGYQWQAKYRLKKEFEFGLQGIGEVGEWDHWENSDEQVHRIGPAIFGKFAVGQKQAVKYNAALLLGASDVAPDHTFRMQVEYEF
jgi:hypothetical protein